MYLQKQNGTSFDYYKTKNEKQVDVLLSGIKNGEEIIKYFENNNYTRNNILVIIALVLTTLGIIKLIKKNRINYSFLNWKPLLLKKRI